MKNTIINKRTTKVVLAALFVAVAYIFLFVFRFNVSFLTFEGKDSIIALGALIIGPAAAVVMSASVTFLEFITISDTGIYGLIMNFLACVSFSFTASFIYSRRRSAGGALLALGCASAVMTVVMLSANFVVTPYYMGVSAAEVAKFIPTLLLPFNLTKTILNSALVLLLYKPVITSLKRAGLVAGEHVYKLDRRTVLIMAMAVALITLSVVVFIVILNGSFKVFA